MRVSVDQQLQGGVPLELRHRDRAKSAALVARPVRSARVRASHRKRARPVRMQRTKRADRESVSHDRPHHPVSSIFLLAKPVAVLDARVPSGEIPGPGADVILDADIVPQDLVPPAVMISGDPENRKARVAEIGECSKRAEAAAGNHRFPFEPEIEEIAVDHERSGSGCQSPQETDQRALRLERRDAKVRIGDYVTGGGEHWRIVVTSDGVHKPARRVPTIYLKAR